MTSLFSRLQKLNKDGTEPPWRVTPGEDGVNRRIAAGTRQVGVPYLENDAALIVECRNSLPAVLNLIEATHRLTEAARAYDEACSTGGRDLIRKTRLPYVNALEDAEEVVAVFVSGQEAK